MPVADVTIGVPTEEVPKAPKWELVYERDFPEAETYKGKCTHEDVAFLVDPLHVVGDWKEWAETGLPADLIDKYGTQTPLRLKIYVGKTKVLWGLTEWPAIRVESWHHGSPGIVLVLAMVIGTVTVIWAFLAWLFKESEEVVWPAAVGIGGVILIFLVLAALSKLPRRRERR